MISTTSQITYEEHQESNSITLQTRTSDPFKTTREFGNDLNDSKNDDDLNEYPEGGTQAYLTVLGSFIGLIPAFGLLNSVGAIETYISQNQLVNVSRSSISWIFSIFTFFLFASGIFSGAVFDRSGAKRPLIAGTTLMCGGILGTANSTKVWEFVLSFGIVTGFGNGILFSPLVGVIAHYFKDKRATFTSVATTGGSVGGIVIPLILKKLYASIGFVWALRVLSLFFAGCLGIAIILSKERIKQEKGRDSEVSDNRLGRFFRIYILGSFDYRYLFELKFIACAIGVCFSEASLVVFTVYFPSYAIQRGFSESTAYTLITIMNTTGILGRYLPGYVADKWIGRFNVMIFTICCCVLTSLCILLPFGGHLGALYGFTAIYGFLSGTVLSLPPVCCGQISKTEEFGKRYSTMYMLTAFTLLAVIPIGGLIVGSGDIRDYNNFIIFTSLLFLVGAASYFVSRASVVGLRLCKF